MSKEIKPQTMIPENYQNLVSKISETYAYGKHKAIIAVNTSMIEIYWQIGEHIVEYEQGGKTKITLWYCIDGKFIEGLDLIHWEMV